MVSPNHVCLCLKNAGLRSLYTLISEGMSDLEYLQVIMNLPLYLLIVKAVHFKETKHCNLE